MENVKEKGLEYLNPNQIERNPENPRIRFEEKRMHDLLESIDAIGILVPLIVFYDDKQKKYILLDGERRWRCSITLKLDKVPANIVAKPTRLQNILEMFNIHNVRIEWGAMEVAWKLKVIMDEFGIEKESELAKLTSLSSSEIRKSKVLLSYPKKYQDMVHDGPNYGGIKGDFLLEIKPTINWLEKEQKYTRGAVNKFIDTLIKKHKEGVIKNYVTDFRKLSKILKSGLQEKKINNIIFSIGEKEHYSIEDAYEDSIQYTININDIEKKAKGLSKSLSELSIDVTNRDGNKKLLKTLNELIGSINDIIKKL